MEYSLLQPSRMDASISLGFKLWHLIDGFHVTCLLQLPQGKIRHSNRDSHTQTLEKCSVVLIANED